MFKITCVRCQSSKTAEHLVKPNKNQHFVKSIVLMTEFCPGGQYRSRRCKRKHFIVDFFSVKP